MRVIHFVPYYPPDRVGGVGELVASLHEGLLRRGHDSTVVTSGRGCAGGVCRIARTRLGWFLGTLGWARRAAACDVVHCQSGEALPVLLALRLVPRRRARILATFHSSTARVLAAERRYALEGRSFGEPFFSHLPRVLLAWLHEAIDALTLRLADGACAVCRASAIDLFGSRLGAAMRVIYNGVADPPARDADAEASPVELLYVGLARHCKRVNALPFVLREVLREIPGARLRIAGFELEAQPELRSLFEEFGLLPHVECVGRQSSTQLAPYYRAARVLVVPSAYEGLPYVILEAMRSGTPVVATRVSGHPEVIEDGRNGFLVEVDHPAALAARCVEILRDPAQAERLARAGRETLTRRFGLARQLDEYLEYYEALSRGEA